MRLYLSSQELGNQPNRLVELVGENKRVALVMNATDYHSETDRKERLDKEVEILEGAGFDVEELDLRDYFGKEEDLRKKLEEFGLVWIRGGNTFLLLTAMNKSGFSRIIKELLAEDKIVYGGYSAGAVAATPTLKGIDLVDYPKVDVDYMKETPWEALGLVNYSIAPHYQSDHHESDGIEKVVAYFKKNNMLYKTLHDGEVILIDGDKEEFLD